MASQDLQSAGQAKASSAPDEFPHTTRGSESPGAQHDATVSPTSLPTQPVRWCLPHQRYAAIGIAQPGSCAQVHNSCCVPH